MSEQKMEVLMAAVECRGLAKVGGLGDVVRDLSAALQNLGIPVRIVLPGYSQAPAMNTPKFTEIAQFTVKFGQRADYPVTAALGEVDGVPVYLLRSPDFFGGPYGDIYIDSDRLGKGPFEDDAQRFAFFSAAVAAALHELPDFAGITAVHCHDWHTSTLLFLLKNDPRYQASGSRLHTVFTIHNLDYQGVRPFDLPDSHPYASFSGWFPELFEDLNNTGALAEISDLYAPIPCYNPMRAGINLARRVNTVSRRYAEEITQADDPARNFIGGRGLEGDLRRRGSHLSGILNGLDYVQNDPNRLQPPFDAGLPGWQADRAKHKTRLLENLPTLLRDMAARLGPGFKNSASVLAKIDQYQPASILDKPLIVAVTRAVRQKASILLEPFSADQPGSVMDEILKRDVTCIVIGTGELEKPLEALNASPNAWYLAAFDAGFANLLYQAGDLFLMPSDFEPCGISQMVAMRFGTLPIVPAVGGLSDTVTDMHSGFVYTGADRGQTRQALLATLDRALQCYTHDPQHWAAMQMEAMRARFAWRGSAEAYIHLYQ